MDNYHTFWCIGGQRLDSSQRREAFTPLYEAMIRFLADGYAIIYAVENSINNVISSLSKLDASVKGYIERGALHLIEADFFYSPSNVNFDCDAIMSRWGKVISSIRAKQFKGIIVMGMPHRAFFSSAQNQQNLVKYEELVAKFHDGSIKIFCCYTKDLIARLSFSYLIRLLNAHQEIAVHGGTKELLLAPSICVDTITLIEGGLTAALGKETCALVLKTLKLVYKLDWVDIVASPSSFEEKMMKIFGESTAIILRMIVQSISNTITGM